MLLQFLEWLEAGEKTPLDLLRFCLDRIASEDAEVRAWAAISPEEIRGSGPLRGIPYGAKDIFETRGMCTEYGSPLYSGRLGTEDARAILQLRSQGAVLLGKTHTTAFASFDPAPTRNPRLPGHTPGGSSAGSAAAVAAGMVPFSLGTQTLGSVIRPASYCGVCGLRSTRISMVGVLPFAPTLDTGGLFAETAADMAELWVRSFGARSDATLDRAADFGAPSVGVERLRKAGVAVTSIEPPEGWDRLIAAAYCINEYEGSRTHAGLYQQFGERLGLKLAALIRRGLEISDDKYAEAVQDSKRMQSGMAELFDSYPVVLSASATGPAPAGFESTGDPAANAGWSALLGPVITVPIPDDLVGLQIAGRPGGDDALVSRAAHAERLLRE